MHLFYLNIAHQMYDHWQGLCQFTNDDLSSLEDINHVASSKEKYSISQQEWKNIQEGLIRSAKLFPSTLGEQVRSLKDLKKAAQWKTWAHILSPVILKGRLPEPFYAQWIALTKAFRIATDTSITRPQLKFILVLSALHIFVVKNTQKVSTNGCITYVSEVRVPIFPSVFVE